MKMKGTADSFPLCLSFALYHLSEQTLLQTPIHVLDNLLDAISSAVGSLTNPSRIADSFTKIVVVKDNIIPWRDENGILYVGSEKLLLDPTIVS